MIIKALRFSPARLLLTVCSFGLLFWTACSLAPAPTRIGPGGSTTNGTLGKHRIKLQDGTKANLSDYAGQVVVLDFWATYCPPCVAAMPDFEVLQKQYGAQGLRVVGLNVGGPEDAAEVPKFLTERKLSYLIGYPADDSITNYYMGQDSRIPQTLVYDRQGKLLKHFVGYNDQIKQQLADTIAQAVK